LRLQAKHRLLSVSFDLFQLYSCPVLVHLFRVEASETTNVAARASDRTPENTVFAGEQMANCKDMDGNLCVSRRKICKVPGHREAQRSLRLKN
jgi:hypothetical protein